MKQDAGLRAWEASSVHAAFVAGLLGCCLLGCGLGDKARACDRVAKAFSVPDRPATSKPSELSAAAKRFRESARQARDLQKLPPELEALRDQATHQIQAAAKQLDVAARAKAAAKAPEFAAARLKVEEARRALVDVAARFDKICSR